jgi:hypothetical protein
MHLKLRLQRPFLSFIDWGIKTEVGFGSHLYQSGCHCVAAFFSRV